MNDLMKTEKNTPDFFYHSSSDQAGRNTALHWKSDTLQWHCRHHGVDLLEASDQGSRLG
jgi:hypothetical protein